MRNIQQQIPALTGQASLDVRGTQETMPWGRAAQGGLCSATGFLQGWPPRMDHHELLVLQYVLKTPSSRSSLQSVAEAIASEKSTPGSCARAGGVSGVSQLSSRHTS